MRKLRGPANSGLQGKWPLKRCLCVCVCVCVGVCVGVWILLEQYFTGRMLFLAPNQQRQGTEGTKQYR